MTEPLGILKITKWTKWTPKLLSFHYNPLFWHLKVGGEASSDVLLTGWLLEGVVVALGVLLWANWALNLCGQWLEASHMAPMGALVHAKSRK